MKKILITILAGTLVAGSAFAADAKITLNYRSRLEAFAQDTVDDGSKKKTTREWMDWQGSGYNGASSDTFKFVLNGERAGVTFAVNLFNNADGKTVTTTTGITYAGSETAKQDQTSKAYKANSTSSMSSLIQLNEYSAWMNFPIGPGTLTLRTGNWKDGYADGNYRVKKDVDAQNAEGLDFERFKLGSILKGSKSLVYVDDLAFSRGQTATSGFADYGFKVNDDISLNVLVGGNYLKGFDETVDGDTTSTWNSAFVSRIQFGMKDVLNAELIYKLSHLKNEHTTNTFALYVMPKILDELTLNVGGAVEIGGGKNGATKEADKEYTDWGVDLRLRYQVMDPLSITFFTNVSGTSLDTGRQVSAGIAGSDGKQGWSQAKVWPNDKGEALKNSAMFKVAMWNNLSGQYKINDLLTASLNLGLITPLSKIDGDNSSYSPEWRVVPAIKISAGSNALVWAGVAISGASIEDYSVFNVSVPVIFRVKM